MTAPVPITTGMRLTPSRLYSPWRSYSPQWTATTVTPTIGNGTLTGRWRYITDGWVAFNVLLIPGTTSGLGSGQYRISLPVATTAGVVSPHVPCTVLIGGGTLYPLLGWAFHDASTSILALYRANPATENITSWTSTTPGSFGTGSVLSISGMYAI